MLEVLNYLKTVNTIEDINLDDLAKLLSSPTMMHKNFVIKVVATGSIVVYNKNINKNTRIKCVNNYYDLGAKECLAIKEEIDSDDLNHGCKECHLKCLAKQAAGILNRK